MPPSELEGGVSCSGELSAGAVASAEPSNSRICWSKYMSNFSHSTLLVYGFLTSSWYKSTNIVFKLSNNLSIQDRCSNDW